VKGDTITLTLNAPITAQVYDSATNKPVEGSEVKELKVQGETIGADINVYGNEFELKDGQYLLIQAPVSMIYLVQEDSYTGEGYTTTATYSEVGTFTDSQTYGQEPKVTTVGTGTDANGNATVTVRGTTNTHENKVVYTNTRQIEIGTGVNLDFLPYVLVLVGALAIGGVWIFFRKRRTVR
jgi:hypothetical protein